MKALLVTQSIPHYRFPIYELICSNKNYSIDYYVAADDKSKDASLKVLEKRSLPDNSMLKGRWQLFRNIWINDSILWQKKLLLKAISNEYDVVIMTGDIHYLSTWIIALFRRLLGRPTIMWTHGLLRREAGIKLRLRQMFYGLADVLFLYGNRAKQLLIDMGFSNEQLMVVYNSLDYEQQIAIDRSLDNKSIQNQRHELGLKSDERVLITTGRLTEAKKIDYLIEILPKLNQKAATRLIVVGDGPEIVKLKFLAAQLDVLDKVIFYGACYEENVLALLMNISDVFVLPGDAGLSVIHGLTYGIPIVTHDDMNTQKPEVEAIQEGLNGSFYRAKDKSDLIEKIEYWFNQAAQNRQSLKLRCQEVIKKFYNPQYQLKVINTVVNQLAKKK